MTGATAMQPSPDVPDHAGAMRLLFLCARLVTSPDVSRTIRSTIGPSIDWRTVTRVARDHRVLPLLYRTLSNLEVGCVPRDVLGRLQQEVRSNSWANLKLTAELVRVLDVLAADEIPVIPYKGPALAAAVYGDVSLRQFGDLDVILHSKDVGRASESLAALGYRRVRDITGKDVTLFHDRLGVTLEVHWSITGDRHPIQVSPDRLWKNVKPALLGGRPTLVHTAEDLLWILCVHGGQHRWERLLWLCDVAEIVRGQSIDWDRAMHNATELRAGRTLLLGVLLARDLLGAEVPGEVTHAIEADPVLKPLADHVNACLASPSAGPADLGDLERYYIMLGDGLGDRVRIAFRQAVPFFAPTTREKEMLRLPWYLSWVLYVVRPVRLTWNYGLAPIKRWLKALFQS